MKIAQPIINEIMPESSALLIFRGALERLEQLLPEPQPSPLALLEQQQTTRKRASRRRIAKPATSWSWGKP
jgi:hypothetical protein